VGLRIDPEFRDVLPEPSAAHLAALRAGLWDARGTTAPILLWAETDIIIDGMHRYPICQELDLSILLGEVELPDRAAVAEWIRQHQWGQRELGPVAASCVRGEAYSARKGTQGGDHKSGRSNGHLVRLIDVAQAVGARFGVNARTIRRDDRLADGVRQIAENCGPEARRALLAGDHQVSRSAILRLAREDAAAQRQAIAYLLAHKKLPPVERERNSITLPLRLDKLVRSVRRLGIREAEEFQQLFALAVEQAKGGPGVAS
jgi:hypothetical protein